MRISHQHRFVFFSNPKTGSESVRELLDPFADIKNVTFRTRSVENPFYAHMRPIEAKEEFRLRGWRFDDYYRFTFVRNPWARLVSLYAMIYAPDEREGRLARLRSTVTQLLSSEPKHPSKEGFRHWLQQIDVDDRGGGGNDADRWRKYGTYTVAAFAGDGSGALLVDDVFRLEDIDQALPRILKRLDLPGANSLQMPRVNTRRHAPYRDYYDAPGRERVAQLYADDIATYRYEF